MPQLEISTFPSQIFWLIVSFFILYLCISRIIIPKISKVLREREQQIQQNIKESETIYKKTEDINKKCKIRVYFLDFSNIEGMTSKNFVFL